MYDVMSGHLKIASLNSTNSMCSAKERVVPKKGQCQIFLVRFIT